MADVDTTVREAILMYPDLYPHRLAVLDRLFTGYGHAWEWRDGEIVRCENSPEEDTPFWSAERERQEALDSIALEERIAEQSGDLSFAPTSTEIFHRLQYVEERIALCQEIVDTVDERVHQWIEPPIETNLSPHEVNIYPQSSSALAMNVPDDVTPDWREAFEQFKVYATARGWNFTDFREEYPASKPVFDLSKVDQVLEDAWNARSKES